MRPLDSTRLARPALAAAVLLLAACAHVGDTVPPNSALTVQGIPPIPASLAAKVAPYTEFRPYALASWHPARHELVVARRATNTTQLFDVRSPLGAPAQVTDFSEPVRWGAWWPAKPDALVFVRDAGGNEQSQLYRLDPGAKEPILLTDSARQHQPLAFNRARDRLLVGSTDVDKAGGRRENPTLDVALVDPGARGRARDEGRAQLDDASGDVVRRDRARPEEARRGAVLVLARTTAGGQEPCLSARCDRVHRDGVQLLAVLGAGHVAHGRLVLPREDVADEEQHEREARGDHVSAQHARTIAQTRTNCICISISNVQRSAR